VRVSKEEDWRFCPLLRQLETAAANLTAWNELFRRTRQPLMDERDSQVKARMFLNPNSAAFESSFDDFPSRK